MSWLSLGRVKRFVSPARVSKNQPSGAEKGSNISVARSCAAANQRGLESDW